MRTHIVGTVIAVLLELAGLAQAAELLSPPLPTGVGTTGVCNIRNTGSTALWVQVSILSNNASVLMFDGCYDAMLGPGRTCQVAVDLPDSSYAACSVAAVNVAKLRGTFEVQAEVPAPGFPNGLHRVLAAEELR